MNIWFLLLKGIALPILTGPLGVNGDQLNLNTSDTCQPHKVCNNADDILTAIISNQENYQRLMEAFYPVNHGVPQFVSLIFFTNGTPISQPLCNQTPYAGMIMELNGEDNVYGTMWYASSANILATGTILNELGLMVPQVISGVFFKTNPIITAFPLVCLTVPYQIPQSKTLLQSDTLLVGMHALYVCTYICIYIACITHIQFEGTNQLLLKDQMIGISANYAKHTYISLRWFIF